MPVWTNNTAAEVFRGTLAEYDQVDYAGSLLDYNFIQNANGSVSVSRAGFGTDILWDVDGFWFFGSEAWYSIADAIALTSSGPYVDENGVFTGTDGNDRMVGTAGEMDIFYGGMGNDQFIGGDDWYDQGEYDGELVEYTITQNANGTITMSHPTWGRDTLTDIDGFWFIREGAWYSAEDAIALTADLPRFRMDADNVLNGTPGNDVMPSAPGGTNFYGGTGRDTYNGRVAAYDQVNFDGDFADYTFTALNNGSVQAYHEVWGTDVLNNIDGVWFNGEDAPGEWMSIEDLTDGVQRTAIADAMDADMSLFA